MSRKFRRTKVREQFGAAPYRIGSDGRLEVMLVTTRETHRWMVPKGWPIKKLGPLGTAMREAYEEAGVRGEGGPAIGAFDYLKVMRKGPNQICEVEVFPLLVQEELEDWPEKAERVRRWFRTDEASAAVEEERLQMILLDLPKRIRRDG
ncbi:NUDIX hydrolase [Chenggangzhangella methanolivorans]|uniref:NUDIX hydrolase n=1 Tax=Chenggangzhangella methanolivorans TaxID=1437009 RepID=A0A9E6RB19_9HYPH|nr:NUDIX hydrolase [Chenggangzhangella methanolivorans]QZO01075.1 NUDIX hydrolase [Chenggangzhangella methanolivorans]